MFAVNVCERISVYWIHKARTLMKPLKHPIESLEPSLEPFKLPPEHIRPSPEPLKPSSL